MRPISRIAIAAGLIFAGGLGLWLRQLDIGLPDASAIVDYRSPPGQVFIPIEAIPPIVIHAFLAAEDNDFYRHGAVDLAMTLRAMGLDVLHFESGRRPIGASTITQQLVKNLLIGDELSITRKLREALLALRIERRLTKDRILEIYLNEVYLGCRSHGVAEAAMNYFGKPVTDLSVEQAAFLGGLPKGPGHYSPVRHPQAAERRRNWVVDHMVEDGYLPAAEAAALKSAPIRLAANRCDADGGGVDAKAPLGVEAAPSGPG
jgi:penicillin-binding protein 1A